MTFGQSGAMGYIIIYPESSWVKNDIPLFVV
jgi:hypothetical protein